MNDGRKGDALKLRWDLLPWSAVEDVVRALTWGAYKYGDNNWYKVRPKSRYLAAAIRHIVAWIKGDHFDKETGIPALGMAACDLLIRLATDRRQFPAQYEASAKTYRRAFKRLVGASRKRVQSEAEKPVDESTAVPM